MFAYGNMIRYDATQVDLISFSLFYVQTWNVTHIFFHGGWGLAWIYMRDRINPMTLIGRHIEQQISKYNTIKEAVQLKQTNQLFSRQLNEYQTRKATNNY